MQCFVLATEFESCVTQEPPVAEPRNLDGSKDRGVFD